MNVSSFNAGQFRRRLGSAISHFYPQHGHMRVQQVPRHMLCQNVGRVPTSKYLKILESARAVYFLYPKGLHTKMAHFASTFTLRYAQSRRRILIKFALEINAQIPA